MSLGGGGGAGKTNVGGATIDPNLSGINALVLDQMTRGVGATGGLPQALQPNPFALPSPAETQIHEAAARLPFEPLINPAEGQGLADMRSVSDPTVGLDLAKAMFERAGAPIIANQATARGMGRSGAALEALGTGFGSMVLPLFQEAQRNMFNLGGRELGFGDTLEARRLGRLQTGLNAASAPRLAQSAEYMRPLNTITQMLGGLPAGGGTTGQTQLTSGTTRSTNWLSDVAVPLLSTLLLR